MGGDLVGDMGTPAVAISLWRTVWPSVLEFLRLRLIEYEDRGGGISSPEKPPTRKLGSTALLPTRGRIRFVRRLSA
jgi:hypothetical protein